MLDEVKCNEKSVLTTAFHADVLTFLDAARKLQGAPAGTYITFSVNQQNYCSAVGRTGEIITSPFRWDASGVWFNTGKTPYETERDLLDHLVDDQEPLPLYPNT